MGAGAARALEQDADLDVDPLAEMLLLSDAASLELAVRQGGRGVGLERPLYAPHCDLVRECRTLTQLAEVVDGLVQAWWRRRGAVR